MDSEINPSSQPAFFKMRSLTSRRAITNTQAVADTAQTEVNTAGPLSTFKLDILPALNQNQNRVQVEVEGQDK